MPDDSKSQEEFFVYLENILEIELTDWQKQLIVKYSKMGEPQKRLALVQPKRNSLTGRRADVIIMDEWRGR